MAIRGSFLSVRTLLPSREKLAVSAGIYQARCYTLLITQSPWNQWEINAEKQWWTLDSAFLTVKMCPRVRIVGDG